MPPGVGITLSDCRELGYGEPELPHRATSVGTWEGRLQALERAERVRDYERLLMCALAGAIGRSTESTAGGGTLEWWWSRTGCQKTR